MPRKVYTPQFKESAVRLASAPGEASRAWPTSLALRSGRCGAE